ncbi:SurA N-terminal domain-containing protein [Luteimonas sp. MC1895]|uniref:SurA N-terminal domain-containing protein n=1 Tax=Luteimonas sp. MC1895 TaxID=2819513 RepID=UPI0018F0B94B|nr:SurA N-terminal domain-containing protein [Luteimonas sp. MC1895]MBJ6979608.1 SurA N-terminal domain-containing protein [Luteimonas sp. MC1895]
MLQALRDKTSGWIAIAIVIMLAIPFAFFGMEQYLFQNSANYAAKVESPPSWWRSAPDVWPVRKAVWVSREVTPEEFRQEFEMARQQARATQGEAFDARAFEQVDSKLAVLDQLIDRAVLGLAAESAGVAVGDDQVRDVLQAMPEFQVEGRFDPQRYQMLLQSRVPAQTPRQHQDELRARLQMVLLPSRVAATAFASEGQVTRIMELLGQQRDASVALLPAPAADTAAVSAAELQAWYDAHRGEYRAPEQVSIEYVEISPGDVPAAQPADEATLRTRYEQEKARFVEPEQRLVSHILVRVPEGADAAARDAAKARADAIATKARAEGADFAAIAGQESDDEGSKAAGGDLGWLERGIMGESFDAAVAAVEPGVPSAPVLTDFGWHVLLVREVREGQEVSFEDAREQLAATQAVSDGERAFNDLIGRLVDQVYRNPSSLGPAAREAGLPVQKVGPFIRGGGEGIAANPLVQRAAFSDALVQDGTVSDPIELGTNHSVLIRVTAHDPERERPLADVRDEVVAAVRADRARKAVLAQADAAVAEVSAGKPLSEVAAAQGWMHMPMPGTPRGMPMPSAEANEAIFAAPIPADGKVSAGRVLQEDGSVVVYAVEKVTPGDVASASAEERTMLQAQLARMAGDEDAMALMRALRQRMRVTTVEARL